MWPLVSCTSNQSMLRMVSVHFNPDKPHLLLVEYNPKRVNSLDLLDILRYQGLHGELVAL